MFVSVQLHIISIPDVGVPADQKNAKDEQNAISFIEYQWYNVCILMVTGKTEGLISKKKTGMAKYINNN